MNACLYPEAWLLYAKGLHWQPSYHQSQNRVSLSEKRRNLKAIELYTKSLNLDPSIHEARLRRAECYGSLGQYKEAQADLSQLTQRGSHRDQAFFLQASLLYQSKEFAASQSLFETLIHWIEDDPSRFEPWQRKQIIQIQLENHIILNHWHEAIETLKLGRQHQANKYRYRIKNATIPIELALLAGDLKEAKHLLSQHDNLSLNSNSKPHIKWLGWVLYELEGFASDASPLNWSENSPHKPTILYEHLSHLELSIESEMRLRKLYHGAVAPQGEGSVKQSIKDMP